jgi:excisionase family DNA binding protein
MASTDLHEYLTVAEVAGILKLNQQTVRNWIDRGELPALRVGRRARILRSDFDALIEDASGANHPDPGP